MIDEIKKDIFERLSSQLMGVTSQAAQSECGALQDQKELHDAIAAALETQMKLAMESFHKQRQDEEKKAKQDKEKDALSPPKHTRNHAALINATAGRQSRTSVHHPHHGDFALDGARDNDISCDQLDDFVPVDATYAMKYRFVKYRSSSSFSPPSPNGGKSSMRAAGAQRILKACERLEQAEHDCRIDAVTSMEVDPMGIKKSSLKILLMGARDLPTSHLRTKNLDPYVSLEIVYPEHIAAASSKQSSGSRGRDMGSSVSHAADETCHSSYPSFRSRTKKKSMYPVWDEEFEFTPVLSLKGYLHVRILNDRKLSREQLVGEVRVPLRTLLHQKKTVDWFTLRVAVPSASSSCTEFSGLRKSTTILRSSGGSIRPQLQLTYSRLEKYKRAVDELATKYFHEHNQLPPFIEPVSHIIDRRKAHNQEQYEESDTLDRHRFVSHEDANALRELQRQQQYDNDDGVPETESPAKDPDPVAIPTFESWQAAQAEAAQQARARESNTENGNYSHGYASIGSSPQRTSADVLIASHIYDSTSLASHGGGSSFVPRFSAEMSRLLWETPPPPHRMVDLQQQQQTNHPDANHAHRAHEATRDRSSANMLRHPSLTTQGHTRSNPPATVKVASTLTAAISSAAVRTRGSQKIYHQSQTFNSLMRRKTTGTASERPECFDDYSPYHPDFKFSDLLDLGNMDHFVKKRKATNLYAWQSSMRGGAAGSSGMVPVAAGTLDFNRKTDLRISKSPGFSRRQPPTGFPERYVGLDNQTCERLKRMFGRMDGGTAG